jgi:hypothetical protein
MKGDLNTAQISSRYGLAIEAARRQVVRQLSPYVLLQRVAGEPGGGGIRSRRRGCHETFHPVEYVGQ